LAQHFDSRDRLRQSCSSLSNMTGFPARDMSHRPVVQASPSQWHHEFTKSFEGINSERTNRRKDDRFGSPCYVVAEIGINHNGDMNIAKRLIVFARRIRLQCG